MEVFRPREVKLWCVGYGICLTVSWEDEKFAEAEAVPRGRAAPTTLKFSLTTSGVQRLFS